MLLYELAIVLDKRSPDLVDAAAELGLGDLQPASDLDAQQVAALRAHFAGSGAAPEPPPRGSAAIRPSSAGAPLSFGPAPAAAAGPTGPPVSTAAGAPTAPAHWGPPPGATAPPPPAPPVGGSEQAHVGPSFAYPESAVARGAAVPSGLAGATLPPPGGTTPSPAAAASAPTEGMGTGQKVVIGAVVSMVVALFGFMALNTGPDEKRQQAMAEDAAKLEAELNATTAPEATTTAVPTTAKPTPSAYDPVDVLRFCEGGIAVASFDLRLTAALADRDFAELNGLLRDRRAGWNADLDVMASGAAPILHDDIERYRRGYDALFDAIASSSSFEQAYGKVDRLGLARAASAGQEIGGQIAGACG